MEKVLQIDGKEVRMRASALVPRLYRVRFGRDMVKDMATLRKAYKKVNDLPEEATQEEIEEAQFSVLDLTIFENVAYIMAKHADANVANTVEDWLDGFNMFSIYEVMPSILELWQLSQQTTSIPKKK